MQTTSTAQRKPAFAQLLRSPWLHPLNDADAWEALLSTLNPMWSGRDFPVRVKQVVSETADTKTFVLEAGRNWPGHRAGQHVVLEVEVDGRRLHRTFSLSSSPSSGRTVSLTIKRHANSKVAAWLHAHTKAGDVLRLSAPQGEFGVAPNVRNALEPLLLLSAGSGITPIMAILRELHTEGHSGPIVLLHSCRTEADFIFASALRELAAGWPNLQLRLYFTSDSGRLDAATMARLLPDHARYQALVCGPTGFIEAAEQLYRAAGVPERLRSESFSGRVSMPVGADDMSHKIHCAVTKQSFTASSRSGLLVEAEAAGLKPAHGCRIGICKTCQCLKRSGVVENLRTGVVSAEPNELIQLCISAARSPLELAL